MLTQGIHTCIAAFDILLLQIIRQYQDLIQSVIFSESRIFELTLFFLTSFQDFMLVVEHRQLTTKVEAIVGWEQGFDFSLNFGLLI